MWFMSLELPPLLPLPISWNHPPLWTKPSISWSQALSASWHSLKMFWGLHQKHDGQDHHRTSNALILPGVLTETPKISICCCSPAMGGMGGQAIPSAFTVHGKEGSAPQGKQGPGGSEILPSWKGCISYVFSHRVSSTCCYPICNGLWLQPLKDPGNFGVCSQLRICPGLYSGLQWTCWRLSWLNVSDGRSVQMHSLECVFSAKGEE